MPIVSLLLMGLTESEYCKSIFRSEDDPDHFQTIIFQATTNEYRAISYHPFTLNVCDGLTGSE